jgi:hypothetical protein
MADSLGTKGKIAAMNGIKDAIADISLSTSALGGIATSTYTGTSFAVNATTGQLSNTAALDFTIGAEDIGSTASVVSLNSSTGVLIYIDIETPVSLTTEGTATLAIGALTADL